jgi:hypothetical protein
MSAPLSERWSRAASYDLLYRRLQAALAHAGNTHTLADVIERVKDGRAQFWGDQRACIVTELVRYPRRCDVRYWLAAGELRGVLALEDQVNRWAVIEGADRAQLIGRPGWGRFAQERGWQRAGVVLRKELP